MLNRTIFLFVTSTLIAASVTANASTRKTTDDTTIETALDAALTAHSELGSEFSIQVQSIDHVVYLHGLVESYREKLLVQSIAAQTPGVARVVNSIELNNQ